APLKAALDTYLSETRGPQTSGTPEGSARQVRTDLLETINLVLHRVAGRVESDAVVLVDTQKVALGAAGRMADRWPTTRTVSLVSTPGEGTFDGVARVGTDVFRVITVPLTVDETTIGSLYVATSLDQRY